MNVRVWLNPQGCKVITMDASTRDEWFEQYTVHGRIPPAGIYHVAGVCDLFYMVDFNGFRSTTACQQSISYSQAMSITPFDATTGLGDVSVSGSCIPTKYTFEFEIPDTVLESLSERATLFARPANFSKHVIQTAGKHRGNVFRKRIYKCWTGDALPKLNRALEHWITSIIEHPFEDVLFRCTCRRWQSVHTTSISAALKTKQMRKSRTATIRLDNDWSEKHTIAGYTLHVSDQHVLIISGQLYKVNSVLHARLHLAEFTLPSSNNWQSCTITSPVEFTCITKGIEAVNDGFLSQLIRHRVAVLRNGSLFLQLHTYKSKLTIALALAKAYWAIFALSKQCVPPVIHDFVPRRRVEDRQTKGKRLSVPKCFQHASLAKDGKLQNGLRLDISSIVKAVFDRTGRSIATDFFFKQLAKNKFKPDRITTLRHVVKRDLLNGAKIVGVQSCKKRQSNTQSQKLACPYNSLDADASAQCAAHCGHAHLTGDAMFGFTPADMAVGYKIPKDLITTINRPSISASQCCKQTFNDICN